MFRVASGFVVALALVGAVSASEIEVGESRGATFSGLVDGFPGIFPHDGFPDAPDLLGIGLKVGITEERGIGEFPLLALDAVCLTPGDVTGATLSFNIDDVISSFGPGAEFNGEAAEEILIHPFSGNGVAGIMDPLDYQNIGATPYSVDTTGFGVITDASLQSSGPLPFTVDVTSDLVAELTGGGPSLGFVWRTEDTPTGTSLDNLGDMAAGPPGAAGSTMPYLTVSTGPLHLVDLRCGGQPTACSWDVEPGDLSYDLVRGDVAALAEDEASVQLGEVVCLESGSGDASTVGDEDSATPVPGEAFFYVMRPTTAGGPGTYGKSSRCRERVPFGSGCEGS